MEKRNSYLHNTKDNNFRRTVFPVVIIETKKLLLFKIRFLCFFKISITSFCTLLHKSYDVHGKL